MNALTTGELKKMMESREDFVLVDVLSKKYYKQQHIKGAVNIPLSEGNFKRSVSRTITDKNKKIVLTEVDKINVNNKIAILISYNRHDFDISEEAERFLTEE